jgi:hypothetical protein
MMKFWAKLVACLLIAWLPLLGYPAQVALCPEMSPSTMQSQMKAPHTPGIVGAHKMHEPTQRVLSLHVTAA